MPELTLFDIGVLIVIALAAVTGLMRGFVTEILSLMAWVAAVFALRLFYGPVAATLAEWTNSQATGAVIAFLAIFIITFVLFRMVAGALGSRTRTSIVGPIDRVLGLGFGAIKGLLIATLVFMGINLAYETVWSARAEKPAWLAAGQTYQFLKLVSDAIVDFVEEQRAGEGTAAAGERPDEEGYSDRERSALGDLLDRATEPRRAPADR